MTDPNSERLGKQIRKHIRLEVRLEAEFVIEGDERGRTFRATTRNISRGGICLVVLDAQGALAEEFGRTLPSLKVSLFLRDENNPVAVQAKTTWISSRVGWVMTPAEKEMPVLMGMAFEELGKKDAEIIDSFIEEVISRDRESIAELERKILTRISSRRKGPTPAEEC